jgi:hypothetical protein
MTTLKKVSIVAVLMISILIMGCEKSIFCIQGEGTVTTEVLDIANFDGINLSFSSNVVIRQGATLEVRATGHPNIIDRISTTVSNNIWEIDFDNECYQNYELSIEIITPNINRLEVTGSGDLFVEDFTNQSDLSIRISGSGDMTLNDFEGITSLNIDMSGSGNLVANRDITTLNSLGLNLSGSGDYLGFAISSNDCTVDLSGSGDCETNAVNTLNATISGSGDVSYRGTPTITQNITGSGDLIDVN